MSGRTGPDRRRGAARFQSPLLDKLIDLAPDQARDPVVPLGDSLVALRASVRRESTPA